MNNNELVYWVTLSLMPKMWTKRKMDLYVSCFEKGISVVDMFEKPSLWSEMGMNDEEQELFSKAKDELANNSFLVEDLMSQGYDIIPVTYPEYPTIMKDNLKRNSPLVIYVKGDKKLLQQPSIAIVGSRAASPKSLAFTTSVAQNAAKDGELVVSGFAKGVDRQALDSVVGAGGSSIIVLPQGICTFSSGFRQYYRYISTGKVLVMSVFHPKAPWSVQCAMARNPIIYAMANKIFVAQSDDKGGTWEGVMDGLRKQREIFVRYPEKNEKNANMLLMQKGAKPVDDNGQPIKLSEEETITPEEKIKELLKSGGHFSLKEIKERLSLSLSNIKLKEIIKSMEGISETKEGRSVKFHISRQLSLF